jgi:hypothetical protein
LAGDGVPVGAGSQGAWGGLGGKRRAVFLPEQQQGDGVATGGFAAVAGTGVGVAGQVNGRFSRFGAAVGEDGPEQTAVVVQGGPAFGFGRAARRAEGKLIRCQTQYLFSGPIHSLQNPKGETVKHVFTLCRFVLFTQAARQRCNGRAFHWTRILPQCHILFAWERNTNGANEQIARMDSKIYWCHSSIRQIRDFFAPAGVKLGHEPKNSTVYGD